MQTPLLSLLRCPVTQLPLSVRVISTAVKELDGIPVTVTEEAILENEKDWFYPVIGGVPRLTVEAFIDYEIFLHKHLPDYADKKKYLLQHYGELIEQCIRKNKRTKESFSLEWNIYDYEKDRTFLANDEEMIGRFLQETAETATTLKDKYIFDAGCGNGKLDMLLSRTGAYIVAMDFSNSIEKAYQYNSSARVHFLQGDVQFPPLQFDRFDIVHCSGVLIHTNNTELSFSRIAQTVKPGGKLSTWLYHPRKDWLHNTFNFLRRFTSKLPLKVQYYLYRITLFPLSFVIKRLKGNRQNTREMMVDIMDWMSPEFRWEHHHEEVKGWFAERNYKDVTITTSNNFGFNITGTRQ